MEIKQKFNIRINGQADKPTIIFAHGFGCDQTMWRFVEPEFRGNYSTLLFDYIGCGKTDDSLFNKIRYSSLEGYADDIIEIIEQTHLTNVIFVGHSVSAMIGILASNKKPELFSKLILVGPSPCYINDNDYIGGFESDDIDQLLISLETNYLGWSSAMAPQIIGNPDRPELGEELTNSFCQMSPEIAKVFARTTFLADNREDLNKVKTPSLILQCSNDIIAPVEVGQYLNKELPHSTLKILKATGHCPNLSAPKETALAIKEYIS